MTHTCQLPSPAHDGHRFRCACGKAYACVVEPKLGTYWVAEFKQEHNRDSRRKQRTKLRTAAQRVWAK